MTQDTETIDPAIAPHQMTIDWDVPITMDDGIVLRADVFRPATVGEYPVLLSYGPYAKGLPFQVGYPSAWEKMVADHPSVEFGSSSAYQNWEVADPEQWVPHGYVCVRVDARGCGRSPGFVNHFDCRETQDFHDCIEWAGEQSWSNGKVGLSGISYYAMNQWQVAATNPSHLAALCIWEGASDWYRELTHHGGILCTFATHWYDMQVIPVQHGNAADPGVNPHTGLSVTGDDALSVAELLANRTDYGRDIERHHLEDEYYTERTPDLSQITVPLLSAGNWGGAGLHLRGNVEGFLGAGSQQKWLEMHGEAHWTHYYTAYGRALQREFFDHFLKGEDNGWDARPPVILQVRSANGTFTPRAATSWPLPETDWTTLFLDAKTGTLTPDVPATADVAFDELDEGVTFAIEPLWADTEITGPAAAKVYISSDIDEADLFVVLRAFTPDGDEVTFRGAIDPHSPVAQGWLRASQRKLDPAKSTPARPWHPHDETEPLVPGSIYELDVEIWPTSLALPPDCRLAVTIQGHDYERPTDEVNRLSNFKNDLRGSGPFLHDDPADRPRPPESQIAGSRAAARITLHTGADHPSHVLLPFIPR
jgi:predicted acyl esterase